MTPRLAKVMLRTASLSGLAPFYQDCLGMNAVADGNTLRVGYGGRGAIVEFTATGSADDYTHHRNDRYWKIGITLPDVDMAVASLQRLGVEVSEPAQFMDIGYLCHLQDPAGFQIELLQHDFVGQRAADVGDPSQPLGGGARLGQVTLRTMDIDAAVAFYRDQLAMTLLSVQPVQAYGFTLYFLAFPAESDDPPPDANLEAVHNRPWLWRREYTTLELQHLSDPARSLNAGTEHSESFGYAGLEIDGMAQDSDVRDEAGSLVRLCQRSVSQN